MALLTYIQDLIGDFLICSLCYVFFVGLAYLLVFLLGCIVAAPLAPRTVEAYSRRLQKLGLFLFLLLVVGDFFGCVWGDVIWGRFYQSTDYCGIDFLPFVPIRRMVIDASFAGEPHGLMGITLFQLNLIWFPFALGTWGTAVLWYRKLAKGMGDFSGAPVGAHAIS